MERVRRSEILFAGELLFTGLKALALLSKKKTARLLVIPCFVVESILGFVLSLLLFLRIMNDPTVEMKIAASIILFTELMSVTSELSNIVLKLTAVGEDLSLHQWGRQVISWLAFLCGVYSSSRLLFEFPPLSGPGFGDTPIRFEP